MTNIMNLRKIRIVMGGMGFYISTLMANLVSRLGGLGTVSGVAPELILPILLGKGDVDGSCRRALSHFPFPHIAQMVLDAYYIGAGNPLGKKPRGTPFFAVEPSEMAAALSICGNFVFVWLAKEGHTNPVAINYLEKISLPMPTAITGAMLAGVDVIVVGAGIPNQIPDVIDAVNEWREVTYRVPVTGNMGSYTVKFDPTKFLGERPENLAKPLFMPIVSSNLLAWALKKKLGNRIDGFIVEESTAGGHNAPPRRHGVDATGEPIYDDADQVDHAKLASLGMPFWIGGSKASPEGLELALNKGACGIQVGTALALCEESGLRANIRKEVRRLAFRGELSVRASLQASPTGFPFQVADLEGSLSRSEVLSSVERNCIYGVLRELYEKPDGSVGYRCSAGPIDKFIESGGDVCATNSSCLCAGLMQVSCLGDGSYPPIVTLGKDAIRIAQTLMKNEDDVIHVQDVFNYILAQSVKSE
ncbi:MAG: nitronate monooxygenase [Candidatus Taylorbacteria bacterium]